VGLYLQGAGDDHVHLVEDVFPDHIDALAQEGCWKLVAGAYQGSLVVELWTDSETTSSHLMDSDAAKRFIAALPGSPANQAQGGVDEVVTMHISALRMG
jgi:quinol monooxygenase YgiN